MTPARAAAYSRARQRLARRKPAIAGLSSRSPADEYAAACSALPSRTMTRPSHSTPANAEAYFSRGQAYYDRAVLETVVDGVAVGTGAARKSWFDPAVADFKQAIARDGRRERAWDMLGLIHETTGESDEAIGDYSQEMALNPYGQERAWPTLTACAGAPDQKEKKYRRAAIADYEKAIASGATADDRSCDPYNPLFGLYAAEPAIRPESLGSCGPLLQG